MLTAPLLPAVMIQILVDNREFLSRVSILTLDIDRPITNMSVRLSVRYVPVSDENGLNRHNFFTIR